MICYVMEVYLSHYVMETYLSHYVMETYSKAVLRNDIIRTYVYSCNLGIDM